MKLLYDISTCRSWKATSSGPSRRTSSGSRTTTRAACPDATSSTNAGAAVAAIVKGILDTGYTGYFAHEFIPTRDPMTSLREAVVLCDMTCRDRPDRATSSRGPMKSGSTHGSVLAAVGDSLRCACSPAFFSWSCCHAARRASSRGQDDVGRPRCPEAVERHRGVVLTTGIGPRIIRYAFIGGENILAELAATPATTTALGDWKPWGGHRLWAAPESMPGSYGPDNGPVQAEVEREPRHADATADAAGLEKQIAVTLGGDGHGRHDRTSADEPSPVPLDLAAWALTIMNGGGMVIIPNEPLQVARRGAAAVRAIAAWAYTDLSDPRWTSAASTSGCAPTRR